MQKIKDDVIAGNRKETENLVLQAISENVDPIQVINEGLAAGLKLIGDRFKDGEAFLPEMMLSAMAAKTGIDIATKDMAASISNKGTIVIGTVKGDLHDIGKNLVALILRASGFKVVDLGVDVSEEEFINAIREHKPDFLGLSCLMTTTMVGMGKTIDSLIAEGLRKDVRVIVGGCAVTEDIASQIGADGYARNAASAASLLESLHCA